MRTFVFNETMKLRRQTLIKMGKLFLNDTLQKELPKLNKTLLPGPHPTYRTSLYHEREVLKQRIKLYLGLNYKDTKDYELYEISDFYENLGQFEKKNNNEFIQVIKEACDGCPSGKYYATDLCRNCVAHSCKTVCPKNAISIENNRAYINAEACVGCGLCAKACNYFAIVKLERPCERACAVNAISSDETNAAQIDSEKCINCGACYIACPFGALESPSDMLKVMSHIKNNDKIVAIFAPAIAGQFGPKVQIGQIKQALLNIGFSDACEVALGADLVAKEEAEYLEKTDSLVTTSCCPSFVSYIKKYQKDFEENISPAASPMVELAKHIKKRGQKIVFIGPCIAKKMEAKESKIVNYVLTFEELASLFISFGIEPSSLETLKIEGSNLGWNFAQAGGVSEAVKAYCSKNLMISKMNGISEGNEVFKKIKSVNINLLEGMACEGGCICGPGVMINPLLAKNSLKNTK